MVRPPRGQPLAELAPGQRGLGEQDRRDGPELGQVEVAQVPAEMPGQVAFDPRLV